MTHPAGNETDELLVRAEHGDRGARSELLDQHRDRLRRMVMVRLDRRLLPRLDPSDVVQEALAEAAQKLSDYLRDRPVSFYPWLRRLAWEHLVRLYEQHVKAQRRSVRREAFSIPQLPDESAAQLVNQLAGSNLAPDHRLLQAELKSRMMSGLAQMSDSDREILVLRYLEHLSNGEIAEILGLTDGAVRTRHTRALAKLVHCVNRDTTD